MNKIEPNYFLVNRGLLHSDRWLSEPFTRGQAWVDMFGLAQHTNGFFRVRGIKIAVKRGQLAYSQATLSKRWQWSRGKSRRYLNELEKAGDIVVQQKNHVTTVITIVNYNRWQGDSTIDGQQNGQQTDNRDFLDGAHFQAKNAYSEKEKLPKQANGGQVEGSKPTLDCYVKTKQKIVQQNGQQNGIINNDRNRVYNDRPLTDGTASSTADGQQTDIRRTSDGTHTKNDKNDKNDKNKYMFSIFWKSYPRKVNKAYAKRIFVKLNPSRQLFKKMLSAIEEQKNSIDWKRENGQFIPHPSTWLNGERWADELFHKETTQEQFARLKAKGEI